MLQFSENRQRSIGLSVTANPRTVLSSVGLQEETQAEAEAGTATGRYMSARRVKQAIDAAAAMVFLSLAPRIITAAGTVTVAEGDGSIIINKAAPSATPIQLPTVASRLRLPLLIADFAGNGGDITITPASGEKLMGRAADATWTVTSGGAGLGGSVTLYPIDSVGWIVR